MKISEMSNVKLLLDFEAEITNGFYSTSVARMKREKRLLDEIGKRLGMTKEEIEEVWNRR